MRRYIFALGAAGLSGVLLFLAFPVHDHGWLAWVGLVPLLAAIAGRRAWFGFLAAYLCGIVFFVGVFGWILDAPGYRILHHALLGLYLGAYLGVFGLTFNLISARIGCNFGYLAAPFIWVSLEYIRGNFSFLALPWPLLAYSQYQNPFIIQCASFAGSYGVSFLIVAVNATLATVLMAVLGYIRGQKSCRVSPFFGLPALFLTLGTATLACLAIIYGRVILSQPIAGKEIKISVLQGNIERHKKWDPRYAKAIMGIYEEMTKEAVKSHPSLIVWPEAATPRSITMDRKSYLEIKEIAKTEETPLLIGSTNFQKIRGEGSAGIKYRNSAFLIEPAGEGESQRYDKIRLLPFGEYLPMKDKMPWSYIGVPYIGSYVAGKDYTVFDGPGFRFSVAICWESIFPDLIREFVKRGAQVIINITNEGWFGKTAPYQFLAWNVFRAVENKAYVVRCANTGISCFIDPYGHIVDRVKDKEGRDIRVRGGLTGTVVPLESKTFYTRFGDWLVWLSFAASAGFLILAFLRKKPGEQ
jgi:apolipoprotein N-acyltransferase